jgi:hypothetical protein
MAWGPSCGGWATGQDTTERLQNFRKPTSRASLLRSPPVYPSRQGTCRFFLAAPLLSSPPPSSGNFATPLPNLSCFRLLRFLAIPVVITLYSSIIVGLSELAPRAWIQNVSPVLHQREGRQGVHHQGLCAVALNLRWLAHGFEVSARADVRILFPPSQKESPLGVPTQSAHPGTPPFVLCSSFCVCCYSRCNNMVSLCCWERCSHGLTVV